MLSVLVDELTSIALLLARLAIKRLLRAPWRLNAGLGALGT
ncbi:MAG: hypothetical protein AAGA73_04135 [Pseudomonadota bacterium]